MIAAQRGLLNLSSSTIPSSFGVSKRVRAPMRLLSAWTRRAMGTQVDPGLFSYTSGRFLYNEKRRLEERYVSFNVDALKDVAEQKIGRGKITGLKKLAEGGFNRVFLLTTEDGHEVVAKIPYGITVPKHYTTASEVATTDLLRSKGIPVPRVLGWSSDPNNPVGVEYIIMEKAGGNSLESRWFDLSKEERHYLVTSLVDIETKLFDIPLGHFGSIYYRDDVPAELQQNLYADNTDPKVSSADRRFCIGPTTDYTFWYGKRAGMDIDRGPWKLSSDYLVSIGERERKWTENFGKPRSMRFPHIINFESTNSPEEHIRLLRQYMSVTPYLLGDSSRDEKHRPILRHPDLTPGNVFIGPETHKITCIIDWQHATILPLLLATGYPSMLQSPDSPQPPALQKPALPEDYGSLGPEEKALADELYRRRALFYLYQVFNGGLNKRHLAGMRDQRVLLSQHLIDRAEKQWSGDIFSLKGALIRVAENWEHFDAHLSQPTPCPIQFHKAEIDTYHEQEETWFEMNALMGYWKSELQNMNDDGWVATEAYDAVVKRNIELKQFILDGADPHEVPLVHEQWPFQDREEDI